MGKDFTSGGALKGLRGSKSDNRKPGSIGRTMKGTTKGNPLTPGMTNSPSLYRGLSKGPVKTY